MVPDWGGQGFARCRQLCRFSDAGSDEASTWSGGRRLKSAKARNRGKWGTVGAAGSMGIWPRCQVGRGWSEQRTLFPTLSRARDQAASSARLLAGSGNAERVRRGAPSADIPSLLGENPGTRAGCEKIWQKIGLPGADSQARAKARLP
jgi:hypothetical protein